MILERFAVAAAVEVQTRSGEEAAEGGLHALQPGSVLADIAFEIVAKTVLICDDNKMLRTFVRASLARDGYTCAEAPDAKESVRLARSLRPDLVILDVMMPDGSGLDVLAELRQDPELASTPVVLITAAIRTFGRVRADDFGAERCLTKPFRHTQLRSAVEAALAR